MKRTSLLVVYGLVFCALRIGYSEEAASKDPAVLQQLQMLNQISEEELNEKVDPTYSVLKKLYDVDSPDFLVLRKLLGKADVRKTLNASVRALCANIISQRWDSFSLSGNLYLAGLRAQNSDLREKSRQRLVSFIQPAHIPVLIDTLKVPGPNVAALDILREVTRQNFGPNQKAWTSWWNKTGGQLDMVGSLLKNTQARLAKIDVEPFDQERFWYLPEGVSNAVSPYAERSDAEKQTVGRWNNWAGVDVKRFVDRWDEVKPVLDRIKHQPDPRVNAYLESLAQRPGYDDYACVLLAWRGSRASLPVLQRAYQQRPTVGKALARGTLGDRTALVSLLNGLDKHQKHPLTYGIMDDSVRDLTNSLRQVGVVPAELAFELLAHRRFNFDNAATPSEKRKTFKEAKSWLTNNARDLKYDRRRGYYLSGS